MSHSFLLGRDWDALERQKSNPEEILDPSKSFAARRRAMIRLAAEHAIAGLKTSLGCTMLALKDPTDMITSRSNSLRVFKHSATKRSRSRSLSSRAR